MNLVKTVICCLSLIMFVYPVFSTGDNDLANRGTGSAEDPYIIPETQSAVKVDGKLDDKAWEKALKLDLPYETWPSENIPALVKTECYLTYDRSNLYVAFRAFDPDPSKIRAFYFERDKIIFDDMVVVFLDTFNDERRAFGFRSNARGCQFDDIRSRTGASLAWDAIYDSVGKIYDWGYLVEMAIPFNQLRFQRTKKDQVWGINVRRIYPRDTLYHLDHIKLDRNNFCLMCQFVKIKGFEGISPGRNVELVPTLTAVRTDARSEMPAGDFEKRNQDITPGITARWGITPNMTFIGTAKPDFSQVEADALQLDINEPFALFFEERRPFFYEGIDYFSTNYLAVHTRTMRDPSWGLKLTGKTGKNTIGVYVVRDEITNLIFPGSHGSTSTSLDESNISSVFRYKLDLGKNYTIGLLATDREGADYFNRLLGADGEFRFSKKDRLQFQFLGSNTRYPEAVVEDFGQERDAFAGSALDLNYLHDTRNWDFSVRFQNLTEGFRADLGYMPQVNYRRGDVSTGYTWIGTRRSWYREMSLTGQLIYSQDQYGDLITSGALLKYLYRGPMQSYVTLSGGKFRETYNNVEFDQIQFSFSISFKPSGSLELTFFGILGDRIDYANTRLGQRVNLMPEILIKPSKHMRLELSHIYERLDVADGRLYTANISYLRGDYHFNVRAFLRAILQYVHYNRSAENYLFPISPESSYLSSQLLFCYRINPRTVLFLGYSDNYFGNEDYSLTQSDRTFFIKLSYAWTL